MSVAAAATNRRAPRNKRLRLLAGLIPLLALALYLIISAVAILKLTSPPRRANAQTPAAYGLEYRDLSFPARGGDVMISGWLMPWPSKARAVVLVHGRNMSRSTEFDNRFVEFAAGLQRRGFSVLMIDLRGHGQSGEARLSFGINERRDVEGAVDWLRSQGYRAGSIGVLGVSMGAASGIGAAANDTDIGALVIDSSYAEIYPVMQKHWSGASGLPNLFLPSTVWAGRALLGYDVSAARPVEEIGRIAPRPVMVVHGEEDSYVPITHAHQLKSAYPAAMLWTVPRAEHASAYLSDPQAYVERVADFFASNLKQP
jgi:uncharacterized protein